MKIQRVLALGVTMGLTVLAGQASADVSSYTSNTKSQSVAVGETKWLDLSSARGNQITKRCYFKKGAAAVFFSAETGHISGPNGGLSARIRILQPGPDFWISPANGSFFLTAYDGSRAEGHAVHGGFRAKRTGVYGVRVQVRSTGQSNFSIDDLSLICMN